MKNKTAISCPLLVAMAAGCTNPAIEDRQQVTSAPATIICVVTVCDVVMLDPAGRLPDMPEPETEKTEEKKKGKEPAPEKTKEKGGAYAER